MDSEIDNLNQLDPGQPVNGATLAELLDAVRQVRGMFKNLMLVAHNADGTIKEEVLGSAPADSVNTAAIIEGAVTMEKLDEAVQTLLNNPQPGAKTLVETMFADKCLSERMFDENIIPIEALKGFITSNYLASSASIDAARAVGTNHIKNGAITDRTVDNVGIAKLIGGADNSLLMKVAGTWTAVLLQGGLTYDSGTNSFATNLKFSVAVLADIKPRGTDGGLAISDAWNVRQIGELMDDDDIVTISANRIKLDTGKYLVYIQCPACNVGRHQARLVADPGGTPQAILWGTSTEAPAAATNNVGHSTLLGFFEVTDADIEYEIQHWIEASTGSKDLGKASISNNTTAPVLGGHNEVYTTAFILKVG